MNKKRLLAGLLVLSLLFPILGIVNEGYAGLTMDGSGSCANSPTGNHVPEGPFDITPTCKEQGYEGAWFCRYCSTILSHDGIVPPSEHRWRTGDIIKSATCTEAGLASTYCRFCDDPGPNKEIEPLGHDLYRVETLEDATCQTKGTSLWRCQRLDCDFEKVEEDIPLADHAWIISADPSDYIYYDCRNGGQIRYVCELCGSKSELFDKPPLGAHEWDESIIHIITESTCTEKGEGYYACLQCPAGRQPVDVPTLDHQWERKVKEAPSCTEPGEAIMACSMCGQENPGTNEPLEPLGHQWKDKVIKEPTCTEKGNMLEYCTVCEEEKEPQDIPALDHQWERKVKEAPSCTEPGKAIMACSVCGQENPGTDEHLEPLGHQWNDKVVKEPTCTEKGKALDYCTVCGAEGEKWDIPADGHNWWEEKPMKEPTCVQEGIFYYECSTCHEKKEEIIPATNDHDWVDEFKDPTCTEWGWHKAHCAVCNVTQSTDKEPIDHRWEEKERIAEPTCSQPGRRRIECSMCHEEKEEDIPATNDHNWVDEVVEAPTCTEPGKERLYCSNCGEKGEPWEIPETGHNAVPIPDKPASCAEDGVYGAFKCSVCDMMINEGFREPATGQHNLKHEVLEAATCQEVGMEISYCTVCGWDIEHRVIPILDHQWERKVIEAPSCTEPGEAIMACSMCGQENPGTDEHLEPLGHQWNDKVIEEPTCTEKGKVLEYCSVCDAEGAERDIPATSHDAVPIPDKPASCAEDGVYGAFKCSVCNMVINEGFREPATGQHNWKHEVLVAATCQEVGKEYSYCTVCGEERELQDIPALGHTQGGMEILKEPTCKEAGVAVWKCTLCEQTLDTEFLPIDPNAHEEARTPGEEPTCSLPGYTELIVCRLCNKVIQQQEALPPVPHQESEPLSADPTCSEPGYSGMTMCVYCGIRMNEGYVSAPPTNEHIWIEQSMKEPTCTQEGVRYEECMMCHKKREEIIPATNDHDWVDEFKDPTCTEWGWHKAHCAVCNVTQSTDIEPIDHRWEEKERIAEPTCSHPGRRRIECSMCHKEKEEDIPATDDHNWVDEVVKAPTCTEPGKERLYCSNCGEKGEPWEIPETGHNAVPIPDKPASCEEDGVYGAFKCSVCDMVINEGFREPAFGPHNWAREVVHASTCWMYGLERVYCTICNTEQAMNELPKIDHTWRMEIIIPSTCNKTGTHRMVCAVCYDRTDTLETPLLDHTWKRNTISPPTCNKSGVDVLICAKCGYWGDTVYTPTTEHDWNHLPAKDPTCTEAGYTSGVQCELCAKKDRSEPIPAIPHNQVPIPGVPPTATETGLTEGVRCDMCNTVLVPQQVIPATGNNYQNAYIYGSMNSIVIDNTHSNTADYRNASGKRCKNNLLISFTKADGIDEIASYCPCCRQGDKGLDITDIDGATAQGQPQGSSLLAQRITNSDGEVLLCVCFEMNGKLVPVNGTVTITLPEEVLGNGTLTLPGHDNPLALDRRSGSVSLTLSFNGAAILLRLTQ